MKNLKNPHSIAGQSNTKVRKSHKHDANLQKNSTLYFQIGLILCLLGTYGLFEMKFEKKNIQIAKIEPLEDPTEIYVKPFTIEPDVKVKKQVKKQTQKLTTQAPVIVPNIANIAPPIIDIAKPDVLSNPVPINSIDDFSKPVEIDKPLVINAVEVVPIYPGCEKATTNKERVKCMSEKLGKLVQRRFNTGLAADLGLSGMQKIDVLFRIDKNGYIKDVKTNAKVDQLGDEAKRVVGKIPQMTPGKQRNEPVSVLYSLPIRFEVR